MLWTFVFPVSTQANSKNIRLILMKYSVEFGKRISIILYFERSYIHQHASSSNGFISIPFGFKAEIPYVIHVSFSRGFTQCVSLKLYSDNINLVSVLAHPTEKQQLIDDLELNHLKSIHTRDNIIELIVMCITKRHICMNA